MRPVPVSVRPELLFALAVCAGPGCALSGGTVVSGVATEVVLLANGFVRFEGQRVPTDQFLLEIRQRVRAAAGDSARYPAVRILIEDNPPPGRLDLLLRELQSAGVRHVTLG